MEPSNGNHRIVAERRIRLELYWTPDKETALKELAERSNMSLDELVDVILDDWWNNWFDAVTVAPPGSHIQMGRFVARVPEK